MLLVPCIYTIWTLRSCCVFMTCGIHVPKQETVLFWDLWSWGDFAPGRHVNFLSDEPHRTSIRWGWCAAVEGGHRILPQDTNLCLGWRKRRDHWILAGLPRLLRSGSHWPHRSIDHLASTAAALVWWWKDQRWTSWEPSKSPRTTWKSTGPFILSTLRS